MLKCALLKISGCVCWNILYVYVCIYVCMCVCVCVCVRDKESGMYVCIVHSRSDEKLSLFLSLLSFVMHVVCSLLVGWLIQLGRNA